METILSFENFWKKRDGLPLEPKMLPKEERLRRLGDGEADGESDRINASSSTDGEQRRLLNENASGVGSTKTLPNS